mgnify:CR=1 FL=1
MVGEEMGDCGSRIRQSTMSSGDETVADCDRTARDVLDSERCHGCADSDDVHDRVGAADFMEFDVIHRDSVDTRFDDCEMFEDGQ